MRVTFELWQLISLAGVLLGAYLALGRVLLFQFQRGVERSLAQLKEDGDDRFEQMMDAHRDSAREIRADIEQRFEVIGKISEKVIDLERDFLRHLADLPVHYVRREDYVRGQTVVEAKLDAIASELKVVQIQGGKS